MSENLSSASFPYNNSTPTDGTRNSTDEGCIFADSNAEKVLKVLAYFTILLVSLVGNSLVILVFYKNKQLRRSINYYVLNMAVSDLFTPLTILPVNIVEIISGSTAFMVDTPLVLGNILCKLCYFLPDVSLVVSIESLLLISIDRFIAVVFPLQIQIISSKVRLICLLCTWFVAVAFFVPYFYTFRLHLSGNSYHCVKQWGADQAYHMETHQKYLLAIFITFFLVPVCVLAVIYITIGWTLKRNRRQRKQLSISGRSSAHQKNIQVTRLSVAILIAFIVCIAPFFANLFILIFIRHSLTCAFQTMFPFLSQFMLHSWSAINPCICFTFSKNYRTGLREMIADLAGTSSVRVSTGITSLRKHTSSSASEGISLKVIEEDQEEQRQDEQKEEQEQLRKEQEEDEEEVRTGRRFDDKEKLKNNWEEKEQKLEMEEE